MTLSSMTAFSRVSDESQLGELVWELRSVNHRFLEIYIRLPESLRYLEQDVRTSIQKQLKRGKVDVILQYQPSEAATEKLVLNQTMMKQFAEVEQQFAAHFSGVTTNIADILRWPGMLAKQKNNTEAVGEIAMTGLQKALKELKATRLREGHSLYDCLISGAQNIMVEVKKVASRIKDVLANERARVLERLSSLSLTVDQDRLEQEMVWLAQKADIAEECHRIKTHVDEVMRVLNQGGVAGRRLDFLMQELNREANTIASKSVDVETTQSSVEMKVLIEQMREQVQNVE